MLQTHKHLWFPVFIGITWILMESVIMTEDYWSINLLPTFLPSGNSVIADKFPDDIDGLFR